MHINFVFITAYNHKVSRNLMNGLLSDLGSYIFEQSYNVHLHEEDNFEESSTIFITFFSSIIFRLLCILIRL